MSKRKPKPESWGGYRPGAGRRKAGEIMNAAFEASQSDYGRTFIYMPTVEASREMQAFDRLRMLYKSRWVVNNFGVASGSIDTIARLSVGSGISPQARTKNREWNQEAEAAFNAKCGTAAFGFDVASQVNFYEAQYLILRQILTDGDFFAQLMRSREGAGMARFISGECCQSDMQLESGWYDGVKSNTFGRPEAFRFIKSTMDLQSYTDVPAADVIHMKRIYRNGFVRGVPALRHAINHLHDMTDILGFTKGAFKLSSQIAFVLESAEAGKIDLGSNLAKINQGDGNAFTADRMYPLAGHIQTKPGERYIPLKNEHPGTSFEPFMEFLIRDIACGLGVPPEVIWDITRAGGANMRGAFVMAQYVTEELQQLLINQFCRRFWVFWLWHEIEAGRISYPGDDWWKHDWIPPRLPTVDFTKDGKLLADLVERGLLSPDRYYAMQGLDAETEDETVIRREAIRRKRVEEIAKEEEVEMSVEDCFPPPPGAVNLEKDEPEEKLTPPGKK